MNAAHEDPAEPDDTGPASTGDDRTSADDPSATIDPKERVDPLATTDPLHMADPLHLADPLRTADPLATFDPEMTIDRAADTTEGDQDTSRARIEDATLDQEEQSRIDALCEQFESAWESGDTEPRFEEFIPDDLEWGLRQTLVRELVLLDLQQRKRKNKSLDPTEYLSRVPDCREAVQSAFSQRKSSLPRGYGTVTLPKTIAEGGGSHRRLSHDPSSRYRPTKLHARGGLGAVFRAQDEELNRLVALKEILPDHATNTRHQQRFVFEAEVTGSLEHPGIVPIYGLGRYQDDRPYYAMRFIRGESFREVIAKFHQDHPSPKAGTYFGRDFRVLLRRLIEACNAIHYAHEHGVLHRDIKPANIMLGRYGETLVVDWGLAKLVDSRGPDEEPGVQTTQVQVTGSGTSTSLGVAVGTPMYMSPEQAMGQHNQLTGRTDIYSLGAMLFNIITGQHPVEGRSSREIVSNVREGKVKNVQTVMPHAPKALTSIVRKAMATNASDRYATAVELADDLDRWMDDEVVHAHVGHEGLAERAGRLIRRYRSWTLSAAAALLAITVAAIIAAVLINGARHREAIAKAEAVTYKKDAVGRYRDSREAIDTWLVQSSDALQYFPGTQSVRKRLLQRATEDYQRLASRESGDPELELERARATVKLGDLLRRQEDHGQAEQRYREAMELLTGHFQNTELGPRFRIEHGNTRARLGLAFAGLGRMREAELEFEAAIEELELSLGQPADDETARLLAAAHLNFGQLLFLLDRSDRAIEHLTSSIERVGRLDGPPDARRTLGRAKARELLGKVLAGIGNHDQAIGEFDRTIQLMEPLVEAEPDQPEYFETLVAGHVSKAASQRTMGRITGMFASLRSAAEGYRSLREAIPDIPGNEENLAIALTNLGIAFHESGENQNAESTLNEAAAILTRLVESYGRVPRFRQGLATCQDAWGQVLTDTGNPADEAVLLLQRATMQYQILIEMTREGRVIGPAEDSVEQIERQTRYIEGWAIAQSHWAQALQRLDDHAEAAKLFEGSIDLLTQLMDRNELPRYGNALAHVHHRYGLLLTSSDVDAARAQFEAARERWVGIGPARAPSYAADLAWMLATCPDDSIRDTAAARVYAEEAVEQSPQNPRFLMILALAKVDDPSPDEAMELLEKSKAARGHWVDRDLFVLAIAGHASGDDERSSRSLTDGIQWMDEHRPYNADSLRLRSLAESALEKEAR